MSNSKAMNYFIETLFHTPEDAVRFIEENYNNMSKNDLANIVETFLVLLPSLCIPEEKLDSEIENHSNLYKSKYVIDATDCIAENLCE